MWVAGQVSPELLYSVILSSLDSPEEGHVLTKTTINKLLIGYIFM